MKFISPGIAGVPDRIVLYSGRVCFVELKRPGEKPRPLQVKIHNKIRWFGIPVYVLDSKKAVDDFIEEVIEYE